jgi:hypothetical protein
LVDVHLLDGVNFFVGDIGVITNADPKGEEHFFTNFDYLILINEAELYVFDSEIEIYL